MYHNVIKRHCCIFKRVCPPSRLKRHRWPSQFQRTSQSAIKKARRLSQSARTTSTTTSRLAQTVPGFDGWSQRDRKNHEGTSWVSFETKANQRNHHPTLHTTINKLTQRTKPNWLYYFNIHTGDSFTVTLAVDNPPCSELRWHTSHPLRSAFGEGRSPVRLVISSESRTTSVTFASICWITAGANARQHPGPVKSFDPCVLAWQLVR